MLSYPQNFCENGGIGNKRDGGKRKTDFLKRKNLAPGDFEQ